MTSPEPEQRLWTPYHSVEILCDMTETRSGIPRELALAGAVARVGRLPVGDYLVMGKILIERKSVGDYMNSLYDGRFYRQLAALVRTAPRTLLLVEGCEGYCEKLWPKAVRGSYLKMLSTFRIPTVFTKDEAGSCLFLLELGRLCQSKRSEEHYRPDTSFGTSADKGLHPDRTRLRMLAAIPGIGPAHAGRLLSRFGSIEGLLQAGEAGLREVSGIGPIRARAIMAVLRPTM